MSFFVTFNFGAIFRAFSRSIFLTARPQFCPPLPCRFSFFDAFSTAAIFVTYHLYCHLQYFFTQFHTKKHPAHHRQGAESIKAVAIKKNLITASVIYFRITDKSCPPAKPGACVSPRRASYRQTSQEAPKNLPLASLAPQPVNGRCFSKINFLP